MKFVDEIINGYSVRYLTDDTYHYSFGYFTANKWVDEHRLVLVRSTESELKAFSRHAALVLVDIAAQTEEVLVTLPPAPDTSYGSVYLEGYVVCGSDLYYVEKSEAENVLWHMNVDTREKRRLFADTHELYIPHITNDGRYLSLERMPADTEPYACLRVDTQSGACEQLFEKRFQKPLYEVSHVMICPTDPDTVFFCHEGNTFYISNRLWLFQKGQGMHCMAKQRLDEEGNLGDCFGHECWTPDGRGLWFVKYACSPTPPRGLCYVSVEGEQTDVVYSAYPYWHVSVAPNNRYLAADTQSPGFSGVCLVDTQTGQETMVVQAGTFWQHPTHPHPSFSLDSEWMIFQEWKNERVVVGFVRTADIVK